MRTVIFLLIAGILLTSCIPNFQPPAVCQTDTQEKQEQETATAPVITGGATVETEKKETTKSEPSNKEGLPVKIVKEGELVSFPSLKAKDPDGDKLKYTFTPPLNEKGEWQTKQGDAGEYKITITADDGKTKTSQSVVIIVESKNKPPVIKILKDIAVKEGDKITLKPDISDPEGDSVTIKYSGWMTNNTKTTTHADAGQHRVDITANDGTNTVKETIIITVQDINRPPTLEAISDLRVKEGDKVSLKPRTSDADGDRVILTYSKPFNEEGTWQTETGDAGTYRINLTASDGKDSVSHTFVLHVESTNKQPTLEFRETTITINEGDIVTIYPEVTDPENDAVRVTYSGWITENSYQTDYDDAGVHTVTVTASDGINKVVKTVTVNVRDINRPPEFSPDAFS